MVLSFIESELYAACEVVKNVKYVRFVVSHLGFNLSSPTRLYEDDASTIAVSNNERDTKRLRHTDLRHFAILDLVKNSDMILKLTSTSDNHFDEITKPLGSITHSHHSDAFIGKRPPSCFNF